METSDILFARLKLAAIEINQQNPFGALHIFVSDGNCDDEDLELCLKDSRITEPERDFATRMLEQFTEHQRYAAWAFVDCPDLQEKRARA